MNVPPVRRLRRMSREEIAWRARQMIRARAERAGARLRPTRWRRDALRQVVVRDLWAGGSGSGSWRDIDARFRERVAARAARFPLDPSSSEWLREQILKRWPAAAESAERQADALLSGRYDLLGYRDLTFGRDDRPPDWHLDPVHDRRAPLTFWTDVPYLDPAVGDHKVIWELNRHQHWLKLGRTLWLTRNERCRLAIVRQLHDWLAANPPLMGINWASMLELGLRSLSWTWALHFLFTPQRDEHEGPWLVDMLVALDRHLAQVERNLSIYFSPNTHLTGEALALYAVGAALPELASSQRWMDTGRRILLAEINRQILPDGGHVERSTHYQRYTLDFYLMALLVADRISDDAARPAFAEAVSRLAAWTLAVADAKGRLPLIGDDDGGRLWPFANRECFDVRDSLALAAVLLDRPGLAPWGMQEEVFWLAGTKAAQFQQRHSAPVPHSVESRVLAHTGYVVSRDDQDGCALFDVGCHGFMNGGHAHADALSVTLTLAGRPFLIDPGTCTYTADSRLRDWFRSSFSHNTVTIDGRSQALPAGPFHWATRADARLRGAHLSEAFDWAEGAHDAYVGVEHHRTLIRDGSDGWLIVDQLLGRGDLTVAAHWHFDPAWVLQANGSGRLIATHADGATACVLHEGVVTRTRGAAVPGPGWCSRAYGALQPTWSATVTHRGKLPCSLATWFQSVVSGTPLPRLERVRGDRASGGGFRIVTGARASVFEIRGEAAVTDSEWSGAYVSDARVLRYTIDDDRFVMLDVVNATRARSLREDWISIAATDRVPAMHARLEGDALVLQTTEPPAELRVQGDRLKQVRSVFLNRREMPFRHPDAAGALVIAGGDWRHGDGPGTSSPAGVRLQVALRA